MIEYHKCRVSSFSNWGKAASPEKLKHEAAVNVCVEINQCVGCNHFAAMAQPYRAGVASMAWRTTR